jgi:hypothetical protein
MRNHIVLPTFQPYFSVYNWHANLQSIILNHPDCPSWIYSNYIQLYMDIRPEITFADFYLNNGLLHTASCPFVEQNSISREMVKRVSCLINFMIECIKDGNYIYVLADISRISKYSLDKKRNHEIFLYGFDTHQELFFVADYIEGKYIHFTASFKEVEDAINNMDHTKCEHLKHIEMWRFLPESNYSFDIFHVRNQLFEYVNSVDSSEKYRQKATPYSFRTYGLHIFDIVLKHLQNIEKSNGRLDIRPFYLLYIRYKLMCERLKYLKEKGHMGNVSDYFESYLKLTQLVEANTNLVLKYNFTKKKSKISTIQSTVQTICAEDKALSEKLLFTIDKLVNIQ